MVIKNVGIVDTVVGAIEDGDVRTVVNALRTRVVDPNASTTRAKVPDGRYAYDNAWTLLHHAVFNTPRGVTGPIVETLVHRGADVNASSGPNFGFTPLHCCAIALNGELAYFLISKGADIDARDANGMTMLDVAKTLGPDSEAFVHFFEKSDNNASMRPGADDAAVVAYLAKRMKPDLKRALARIVAKNRRYDRVFLYLAWFVYHVVLEEESGKDLEETMLRKTVFKQKNLFLRAYSLKMKKTIPAHFLAKKFLMHLWYYVKSLDFESSSPGETISTPDLLAKIRAVAKAAIAARRNARSKGNAPPAFSKRAIAQGLSNWTSMQYREIQNAHRGVATASLSGEASLTNASLAKHMRNYGPRAPEIIPGIHRPTYLFRGMHGPLAAAVALDGGLKKWTGYLAFSRDYDISKKFGKTSPDAAETDVDRMGHVLFRLKLDDVPRGTPWIWYLTSGTNEAEMRRKRNTARAGLPEHEVLFPPGRLDFKSDFFRDVSRGIEKGVAAGAAGKQSPIASSQQHNRNNIFGTKKKTLKYDVSSHDPESNAFAAARDLTIAMIRDLPMKNVRLEFSRKPVAFKKIAHMIQLALLDRGIVDYVIDRDMFMHPLEIDVVYVRDRNARSVAYSVPFSKQNNGLSKQKQNVASVSKTKNSTKKNNAAAANRNFFITTLK